MRRLEKRLSLLIALAHNAFKILIGKIMPLTYVVLAQYRILFMFVKDILNDEVRMSPKMLYQTNQRLKKITAD